MTSNLHSKLQNQSHAVHPSNQHE